VQQRNFRKDQIMKIAAPKTKWTGLGFLLALLCGAPIWADDTELLLVTPQNGASPFNANILMIIDSSASMDTLEETNRPYDADRVYTDGDCGTNLIYWTQTGLPPACGDDNNQFVEKSAFVCASASRQIEAIGVYQSVMVQYRSDLTDSTSWRTLGPGYSTEQVECQEDSGVHGTGSDVYAQAATDVGPYTSNADNELAWGSFPASESYTVYDGNYLNWRATPEVAVLSRLDIVKVAVKAAMNSINDANIGIMRFNFQDGGPVIKAMTDLDSNRTALEAVVDSISPSSVNDRTPLSETMYEAALYWLGEDAYYGERINEYPTDPNALLTTEPERYLAPPSPACSKNYNVVLTDGEPTEDLETPDLATTLPGFSAKLDGRTACTGMAQGDCLDDITEYLSIPDLSSTQDGDQFVTTHTIGFTVDLPILKQAAELSGGDYFLADDAEKLSRALLKIFTEANQQDLAFTAPAVAVNAFNRTQNLNDLYLSVFRSDINYRWPGNLKKYRLSGGEIVDADGASAVDSTTGFFNESARSFWTDDDINDGTNVELGGAANQLPTPATRKLFTNNGDTELTALSNAISPANSAAYTIADFGLNGAVDEPTVEEMIDWLRGADIFDEDNSPDTTQRNSMGDPLHSQPATMFYGGEPGTEDIVVYMATNDGYLHAIDAKTGEELWSFIPNELLPRSAALLFNPSARYKSYGIDGDVVPVFLDRDDNGVIDGDDFAYIVFGMRRGGSSFYALDVTNKNAPKLMWNISRPGMGQSWSRPTITRVNVDDDSLDDDNAVVIIGAGYDPVHDTPTFPGTADNSGAGVIMLNLKTGAELWRAGRDMDADLILDDMTRAFPSQIRVIDLDGDRYADRMYAADVGGQLWRFDIFPGNAAGSLVEGGVIAQLGAEGIDSPSATETRRVYNSPDVALFLDTERNRRFLSVNVGTGYRAHPLDTSATDAFYSIRDPAVFNRLTADEYDNYDIATDTDFAEVSGSTQVVLTADDRGWKFTLPASQMVLSNSSIFDDEVFFVAFSPDTVAADDCTVTVGKNFLYRMSIINGDPIVLDISTVADEDADAERVTELKQGGIAPSPQFLFPSPDDPNECEGAECSPPPIGCVGAECFDPGFRPRPVRTLWTQDGIE
jgi:type IV pilus assembly protein PilY1